jgi:hypothetical protein
MDSGETSLQCEHSREGRSPGEGVVRRATVTHTTPLDVTIGSICMWYNTCPSLERHRCRPIFSHEHSIAVHLLSSSHHQLLHWNCRSTIAFLTKIYRESMTCGSSFMCTKAGASTWRRTVSLCAPAKGRIGFLPRDKETNNIPTPFFSHKMLHSTLPELDQDPWSFSFSRIIPNTIFVVWLWKGIWKQVRYTGRESVRSVSI